MELKVRPAQPADIEQIWKIRNEPAALAVAASQEIIPLEKHIAWFKGKYFGDKGNLCFVAEVNEFVVGYSRFDLADGKYLNSIAISSSVHGKGFGTVLLKESITQLGSGKTVLAEVRKFNTVSRKLFERCGFQIESEDDRNIYYRFES